MDLDSAVGGGFFAPAARACRSPAHPAGRRNSSFGRKQFACRARDFVWNNDGLGPACAKHLRQLPFKMEK